MLSLSPNDANMQPIWQNFLAILRKEAGNQVVETWFKSVNLTSWDKASKTLTLLVPNQFVSSWIKQHYQHLLETHLGMLLEATDINFVFQNHTKPEPTPNNIIIPAKTIDNNTVNHSIKLAGNLGTPFEPSPIGKPKKTRKPSDGNTYSSYDFSSFVVGPRNHLAYSAAYAVAQGAGKGYNPLFIYGGTGLGKTHLMHCIGNEGKKRRPNMKIVYKTSDNFVDEFIRSIRLDRMHHFRDKYRKVDLLMIDDVQFFAQKEQTQEAFFHIFNALHESGKQLVLSSDTPPSEIAGLQNRLRSRFGWGLTADIQPPTLETKVAILMKKALEHDFQLSREIATVVASRVKSNIRELEGALTRLIALASLRGEELSIELAKRELAFPAEKREITVSPHDIIEATAKHFAVPASGLRSKDRSKKVAAARKMAAFLMKKHTPCSLKTIGAYLGGRSHSTILYSIVQTENTMETDLVLAQKLTTIENTFSSNL